MTPTRRRRGAAVAAVLLVPTLAACGFGAQSDQQYQPGAGVDHVVGNVDVLNAVVVSKQTGSGVFAGTLVNKTTAKSRLTSISVDGKSTPIQVSVPGQGLVNMATDKKAATELKGSGIKPGNYVSLVLRFDNGQTTRLQVPVWPDSGDYADVAMPGSPSSSPSGKPSPSQSGKTPGLSGLSSSSAAPNASLQPSPSSSPKR